MDLTVTNAPTLTSIDVSLVKANKRIRHADENALIEFWIQAADQYIEKETNLALMTQTLKLRLSRVLPVVQLPRPPLGSVQSISYTIDDGQAGSIDPAGIVVTVVDMLPTIHLPAIEEAGGKMEIVYTAGWPTTGAVPAPLRQASLLLASYYCTSREAGFMDPRIMNVEKKIVFGVDDLVKNYRVPNTNALLNGGW